jgi:hypothetical protein
MRQKLLSRGDLRRVAKKHFWVLALPLLGLAIPTTVYAVTTISQGFSTTDSKARIGSVVSLVNNSSDQVVTASPKNVNDLLGVVIDASNTLLSLSSSQSSQIQVATGGVVDTLVSDINGSISQGDEITASPVDGVGMKATDNTRVVGVAQQALTRSDGTVQTYTNSSGKHTTIVGEIPVLVNVSYYYKQPDKTLIPSTIQNLANALAGKNVQPLPILVSLGIFIITLIVVVSIIYSMIHSSIISVGRNPMSQSAIYRDIIQLSVLVLGILTVAVVAIYMILTRL